MILETLESPNPGKPVKSSLTGSLVFFLTSGDRINIKVLTISCYKHWRVVVSFFKIRNYLFDDVREHVKYWHGRMHPNSMAEISNQNICMI